MQITRPTMKSVLAGFNKTLAQLRTIEANADTTIEEGQKQLEAITLTQNTARAERDAARNVASKIEALIAPDS